MNILQWLFWPMQLFVWHPGRIIAVACIFFIGFVLSALLHRSRSWPLLIPAIAWGMYAPWEAYCQSQKYDIRIDLLLLYPILVVATIGGVLMTLRSRGDGQLQGK